MKYQNANEVLPNALLKEIQKYTSGTLLYIPTENETKVWGELSGYRDELKKRNQMIVNHFQHGETIFQLSEQYGLSIETIKKIVYSKKSEIEKFRPSIESAAKYQEAGLLEEWIHTYLLYERKNTAFSEGLSLESRYYVGPVKMQISLFSRNCGPEDDMKWKVDREIFESKVSNWEEAIEQKKELPPLIVNYENETFEVNCNNPLLEALKRSGKIEYPVILWCTKKEDYDNYCKRYQKTIW